MTSSYFTQPTVRNTSTLYDGRWQGPQGDVLVEVKRSSNARDARDALLALAYALADEPASSQALCILAKSRLTPKRLSDELKKFRSIVRPDLADRVMLVAMDEYGQFIGEIPQNDQKLKNYLNDLVRLELQASDRVSRESVKAYFANRWLQGKESLTQAALQRDTNASAPTVASALGDLTQQGLLYTDHHGVTLMEPSWEAWRRLAETHASKRTKIRFADHSGLSRTPAEMFRRLKDLQSKGIATKASAGGVVGATHYYKDLDITAPPRLDLTVFGGDISFAEHLDAGLVKTDDKEVRAVLVIHLTPGHEHFGEETAAGRIAPPLDCLTDLLEIGLTAEARDFAYALNRRAMIKRNEDSQQ